MQLNEKAIDAGPLDLFMGFSLFLVPAIALVVPTGYSWGAALLLIGSAVTYYQRSSLAAAWRSLPLKVKFIVLFMAAYAIVWIIDAALRGEGVREFDRPSRFLIAAVCLIALTQCRVHVRWFWSGVAVGGGLTGGIALWEKLIVGATRASGTAQTILFGNISMLLGLISIAGLLWATAQPRRGLWVSFMLLGSAGGLAASLLSGTRGAWLVPPVMAIVGLAVTFVLKRGRIQVGLFLIGLATIYLVAYLMPVTGVQDRVDRAITEVRQYVGEGQKQTSVGYRFEMWRGGWILFTERPWLGWGENAFNAQLSKLADSGRIDSGVARFTHSHNEWINVAAKRGIVGLFILFGLYASLFWWFWSYIRFTGKHTRRSNQGAALTPCDREVLGLALGGLVIPITFFVSGQTQVNMNHNAGAMMLSFMAAILVALTVNYQREYMGGVSSA